MTTTVKRRPRLPGPRQLWPIAPWELRVAVSAITVVGLADLVADVVALIDGRLRPLSDEQIARTTGHGANVRADVVLVLIFAAFVFGALMITLGPAMLALSVLLRVRGARAVLGVLAVLLLAAALASGDPSLAIPASVNVAAWILLLLPPVSAFLRTTPLNPP
ncbi:hypothetical protein ACFVU2_02360 [Leifsonia sp. NPDC058194]|uniref:hypothetical protein n=1 Tax=Leifsonia sp. NPDC058194 TaxID=3346374 RepID=UPI0036DABDBD